MVENFEKKLEEYAELIVHIGANVQKGQLVEISAPIEVSYFARILAKKAYEAGARDIVPFWGDEQMAKMKYTYAADEVFDEVYPWAVQRLDTLAARQAAVISISASDPDALSGVDPTKIARAAKASGMALKDYRQKMMSNYFPWCVVSIPTKKWAEKVFPSLKGEEAMDALWNAILSAVRVDGSGNAVKAWEAHVATMDKRAELLNEYDFASLHYTNSLGTDLVVQLPQGHQWISAGEKAATGTRFIANMPTEEIFTLPKRDGVNGVVYSSKPLIVGGTPVEDFMFKFKDGKIVECVAKKGEESLKKAISLDENASYLGEVALVPYHSPISDLGILFYNTLFDENASCHFAFGAAYPCFKDKSLTEQQMEALGKNESITHVDFMIGTSDLNIVGTTKDGKKIQIFKDGNFCI